MKDGAGVLSWLHIGDLHITKAGEQNARDLVRIVDLVRRLPPGILDFVVLPGDNADDGTAEQYHLIRDAIALVPMPVHILAGDHDFKPGNLDAFHESLGAQRLPKAAIVRGHRCLFLDLVSAGQGGPDFRLDDGQLDWIADQLREAASAGQDVAIFMHTYPADLRAGSERLRALLAQPHVVCVDMGHTHYNEIANDGRTIFMATRSTGQIEEGPVGFSIASIDGGGVGWRFRPLDDPWPCVLITSPVDRRLVTAGAQTTDGPVTVRAKVIGDTPIETVSVRVDDGDWASMTPVPGAPSLWEASIARAGTRLAVRARDVNGGTDGDIIEPAGPAWRPPARTGEGSDADRIGAWPEKSICDTQLGPNRNGRHW